MLDWGIGLRPQHFREWLATESWPLFEVLSDNYIYQTGGPALEFLDLLTSRRRPFLHGIGMNIGGLDPIDHRYLEKLKNLQVRTHAELISDHLCFNRGQGIETYDLLPLPYTRPELNRVAERINEVQDFFGQAISLENISAYVQFAQSHMSEIEFLLELSQRTHCRILLDVNNLYVSCCNLGWKAEEELKLIEAPKVSYMHISGYSLRGSCLYDSHDQAVSEGVLALLKAALAQGINVPIILERDDPDLSHELLVHEWERVKQATRPFNIPEPGTQVQPKTRHHHGVQYDSGSTAPQHQFMNRLMTDLALRVSATTLELEPASADNWDVYVNGIVGRWTGLVDATLRRAANVWGKEAIVELLWDFASHNPPQELDMSLAFRALPHSIRDHPDYSRVSGLADLIEACFLYWEVLEDFDPVSHTEQSLPALDTLQLRLKQPAGLHIPRQRGLDLHALWAASALASPSIAIDQWEQLNRRETGILFVKTSPRNLTTMATRPSVVPLIRALVDGKTMEASIKFLMEQTAAVDEEELEFALQSTLQELTQAGLLT